jgi:hypothetical protein
MRKFAAVLYVRNSGALGKFYPWACIVSTDGREGADDCATALAHQAGMEVHCVYSVLDVLDSVG